MSFATGVANVRKSQIVSPGYTIITRGNGRVVLAFSNGHRLRIGPNSSLRLVKYNPKRSRTLLHLKKGRVWNKVRRKRRQRVVVRTRHAVAAVLGTAYEINVSDSQTQAQVFEGSVAVRGPEEVMPDNIFEQIPQLYPAETPAEATTGLQAPTEVQSPVHEVPAPMKAIPGPYEVSQDQWLQLVANQKISISANGQAQIESINPSSISADEWVRWNRSMDAKFTEVRDDKE